MLLTTVDIASCTMSGLEHGQETILHSCCPSIHLTGMQQRPAMGVSGSRGCKADN